VNRSEDLVMIGLADAAILEFLGKCGARRILKAGVQSVSRGVGSFCGYPSQAR
jgi:hypothetical protein